MKWWYDKREKAEDSSTDFEKARDYHNQQMAKLVEKQKREARERDERLLYEKKKADPEFLRVTCDLNFLIPAESNRLFFYGNGSRR